jgi:hypothetical protein
MGYSSIIPKVISGKGRVGQSLFGRNRSGISPLEGIGKLPEELSDRVNIQVY